MFWLYGFTVKKEQHAVVVPVLMRLVIAAVAVPVATVPVKTKNPDCYILRLFPFTMYTDTVIDSFL